MRQPKAVRVPRAGDGVRRARRRRRRRGDHGEQPRDGLRRRRAGGLAGGRAARALPRCWGSACDSAQAYRPYRVTVNGQRIAIIGATQVLDDNLISAWSAGPGQDRARVGEGRAATSLAAVRKARATADTVVVFLHWGEELTGCPTARQRSLARQLVAAGADVVVGSHAHVLLGGGLLGRALVDYGLGNFVFYASRELTVADRRARGDGHRPPHRPVPLGPGAHLGQHAVPAHGGLRRPGRRGLERAARLHRPAALNTSRA